MPTTTSTTTANDPGLDGRITAAILDLVAAGQSVPEATRQVGLSSVAEVREQGWGTREADFIARHVAQLGARLMTGIRDLARTHGLAA